MQNDRLKMNWALILSPRNEIKNNQKIGDIFGLRSSIHLTFQHIQLELFTTAIYKMNPSNDPRPRPNFLNGAFAVFLFLRKNIYLTT